MKVSQGKFLDWAEKNGWICIEDNFGKMYFLTPAGLSVYVEAVGEVLKSESYLSVKINAT